MTHDLAPLIRDLTVILGMASLVTLLFQKLRQPVVLGYLVAGIIIGPYTPPYALISDLPSIEILSSLGVIFLMFSLGLDFSFHKLKKVGFSAGITGTIEVLFMLLLGFLFAKILHWPFYDCLFLGAALAISSTTIIIKALDELNLKNKRFAELIFGILVVEDLLAILLLVALTTIVNTKSALSLDIVWSALNLFIIVGAWFLIGYFLVPTFLRKVMGFANQETLTITSVALCLFLVCVAAYFHYSTALGAFIMGSILAETPLVNRIEHYVMPIRDIFAAIFFVSVGMLIDPKIIIEHWGLVLLISAVTIVGKIIITGLGALLTGQSLQTSTRVGFGMAQIGEFSFIIAGLGLALNAISNHIYPIIVAVSAITTFTTPYLIKASGYVSVQLENKLPRKITQSLENYSALIYRSLARKGNDSFYQKYIFRLVLNSILVAIIFTLTKKWVMPQIDYFVEDAAIVNILSWLVALTVSSPFIWAMLFSFRIASQPQKKILHKPVLLLGWLWTIEEIVMLSFAFFNTGLIAVIFILVMMVFFALSFKRLEKYYHWLEQHLVSNIKKDDIRQVHYNELAPWDTHLVEMKVSQRCPLIDKTLSELAIRQQYNINIVAIYRGLKTIFAPRGEEKLMPADKLIILGNDEKIDIFRAIVETDQLVEEETHGLDDFSLRAILLTKNNPFTNKSISETKIREAINGLVVGLQREQSKILNPDSSTVLLAGDLLIVVGESERVNDLDNIDVE